MKIIAVVVTYNRLSLLKRNIACLKKNKPVHSIIVVNNGSTDGTKEWLAGQEGLIVINQQNVGGSGGFYVGINEAYQFGADWIWCMDDDVFPRPDCLEQMLLYTENKSLGIMAPRRLIDGCVYTNDFLTYNLTNPFSSMYKGRLSKMHIDEPIEISGTAFEGLFVKREVVETIGLPNKDLFIFCDDTDYCLRAVQAGFKILYVPMALMDKEKFFSEDSWAERNKKKKWKRFYQIRNSTYLSHHYGMNFAVRYLRGFNAVIGLMLIVAVTAPFSSAYQWSDVGKLWRAYQDGLAERLGKM